MGCITPEESGIGALGRRCDYIWALLGVMVLVARCVFIDVLIEGHRDV